MSETTKTILTSTMLGAVISAVITGVVSIIMKFFLDKRMAQITNDINTKRDALLMKEKANIDAKFGEINRIQETLSNAYSSSQDHRFQSMQDVWSNILLIRKQVK